MGIIEVLTQVFSLLSSFLESSLKTWLIVLIAFGVAMKQWAKMPGKLIPFAEIGAGLFVAFLNVLGKGMGLIEVFGFVIGQGLLLAFFSMSLYNIYQAVMEVVKLWKEKAAQRINKEETV